MVTSCHVMPCDVMGCDVMLCLGFPMLLFICGWLLPSRVRVCVCVCVDTGLNDDWTTVTNDSATSSPRKLRLETFEHNNSNSNSKPAALDLRTALLMSPKATAQTSRHSKGGLKRGLVHDSVKRRGRCGACCAVHLAWLCHVVSMLRVVLL